MVIGIPTQIYLTALTFVLQLNPLLLTLCVFGVIVVLIFSILYIWRHVRHAREAKEGHV